MWTFNIERTSICIFFFCIGLVALPNDSLWGVSKHHPVAKMIRELLSGNSRFLIQNLLNHLLCCTDVRESCLFVAQILKYLDLNNKGSFDSLAIVFMSG